MTMIAVAIGGLALELVLLAMNRSLAATRAGSTVRQANTPVVIHLTPSETKTGALEWAEKATA